MENGQNYPSGYVKRNNGANTRAYNYNDREDERISQKQKKKMSVQRRASETVSNADEVKAQAWNGKK